ncbi:cyclic 3',5'-adenosine monophosphate phosphodiesterase [Pseudomonas aeruginosa]|uniref:metallophosphoesterase n=1 Tax=Pseudomonas aeruginosa TaxID=287 RepID=UPI000775022D|nr:metallophosphoesterase [Pseudomonas aeruginosa]KXG14937.1 cyclic 3',5'-adenosine monophosphate phosphodiesterase [Pseudomonas aeruginosa]RTR54488.1 serine/threonine protein phosphatase [Pseudomonas aeruginosa]RTR63981.1 serine/threonine protein phosphatase [Pseudomonas aeruginosa]
MKLHLLSDLHNEFDVYQPEQLDADVVVLAGDIDVKQRAIAWAKAKFSCPVIYVPGNHEYYRGQLGNTLQKLRSLQDNQVHVLDCNEVVLDGVRFLGATGWTDYKALGDPAAAARIAQGSMADFKQIRTGSYQRVRPSDFANLALMAYAWLEEKLSTHFAGPTVVVTHHAPSMRSLEGNPHAGSALDAAFANSWDTLLQRSATVWLHGHVHNAVRYEANGVRVIANPRGYPGEATGFDPRLLIEL